MGSHGPFGGVGGVSCNQRGKAEKYIKKGKNAINSTGAPTPMTALDHVASTSPDRTGACGTRRGTLSQRQKVIGRFIHRQFSPIKSGPQPIVRAQCRIRARIPIVPTIVRDWEVSSGESRFEPLFGAERKDERACRCLCARMHWSSPIELVHR